MDLTQLLSFGQGYGDGVIAVLSAGVAVISALIARGETKRQRKLQTERLRQSIDAASLDWGNAAIDALARTAMFARTRHLQANDGAFLANRANMLVALSTLVDRGRMFFPNLTPEKKGAEKEGAYRGHRPPILDALMWTFHELEAMTREGGPASEDSAAFIDECRRLLVSELQAHLDPRRMDQIVGRYDDQESDDRREAIRMSDALRTKLESRRPGFKFGAALTETQGPQ
ncbi:MAG: hypothetical protein FP825_07830 [Hyphomonas sp.]|uniref:hypothetical protein n=1 Tax=Hyphomonas sp. TaxID=87 RepID=UPI001830C8A6|nr:hypothetical protein [Hyphomonas sp.]MBA3068371.1 hypothetical protein [Hyphomonas sp.]MBU3919981.1 hypothetical protein [Alphaproteobacteria bacterium]MBU4060762.1 hypothetical protein [Alphaproteobacteria bacterium]MBU4164746.1 hypothetical protein [Alphaproteobacteria bacterium]